MNDHFSAGVVVGVFATVLIYELLLRSRPAGAPPAPPQSPEEISLEDQPSAYSVTRSGRQCHVTPEQPKARALAKMEKARTPDEAVDLIEYRPSRRLPY